MTAPAPAPDPGAAEPIPMGALSQLVQDANDSGITYQEMADRGAKAVPGSRLSKQWYQKLVKTPPVNGPSPEQMTALAAATGRPLRHIKAAASKQWFQYEATELAGYDEEVRIIVGHLAGKPRSEVKRWRLMMEASDRAQREGEDG